MHSLLTVSWKYNIHMCCWEAIETFQCQFQGMIIQNLKFIFEGPIGVKFKIWIFQWYSMLRECCRGQIWYHGHFQLVMLLQLNNTFQITIDTNAHICIKHAGSLYYQFFNTLIRFFDQEWMNKCYRGVISWYQFC